MDNIETLKKAGSFHAKVGEFTSRPGPENHNPISLRGSSMTSPYQNSYAAYISEALKQELELAGKLAPNADIELSGTLIKNDIDPAIGIGSSNVAGVARLTLCGQ